MTPKLRAIKTQSALNFINSVKETVKQQYLSDLTSIAEHINHFNNRNPLLGGCVYLNSLMCERLQDNGFNAKLVAGRACFGVNKNQFGVIDFGYDDGGMAVLNTDGSSFDGSTFKGHCWIEISNLDLIVDLTLETLKEQIATDNEFRGIVDNDYLLDSSKVVIQRSELLQRKEIISGAVGYDYTENSALAEHAFWSLEKLKGILSH